MADLELKYAHLSNRDSPARKANREALREHIEEIAGRFGLLLAVGIRLDGGQLRQMRRPARGHGQTPDPGTSGWPSAWSARAGPLSR